MEKSQAPIAPAPIPIETVLSAISDSFFLMDRNLVFIYANKPYLQLVGLNAEDMVGKHKLEVFPESVNTQFYPAYLRVLESGIAETVVDYYAPMDRAFESRVTPVPEGLAVYVVEVTERIKEEQRRTEESRLLALALRWGKSATYGWNLASNEVSCCLEFIPTSRTAMTLETWIALIHREDAQRIRDIHLDLHDKPAEAEVAFRLVGQTGNVHHVRLRLFPHQELSGTVSRYEGVLIDETDTKKAQAAAEEDIAIRKLALQAAQAGSWEYDVENETASWSTDFAELTGIATAVDSSVEAFIGIVLPEDQPKFKEASAQSIESHSDLDITFRINHPTRGIRWINSRGRRLASHDAGRMVGISIDVTDLYEAAARIEELNTKLTTINRDLEDRVQERTALLKAANNELEAFCYTVSHDLRAPLRSIFGYSRILQSDYAPLLDERGVHYLDRQQKSAVRLSTLIDDLLQFSRLGRHNLETTMVDFSALVAEVGEELIDREENSGAILEIQPNLTAFGDLRLIRLVIQNLLENSLKFGVVGVPVRIEVGEKFTDRGPALFIRDNGVGIDMTYADRLFRPFERLHTQQEFPGNGIGLANVRRCIEQHEGSIWVESELGVGSIFYFQFSKTAAPTTASR